jgi:peptide/nickel transport system permease protein
VIRLITRRLAQSLFVMAIVSLLAFSLFRFVGDPVSQMVGTETSIEDRERVRESLGLNESVVVQYGRFVQRIVSADFGYSYRTRQPIGEMILSRLPATAELAFASLVISLVLGIPAGIYTAIRRRGFVANTILFVTLVGISVPTFVIGIFLIYIFGVQLGWLPTFGRGDTVALGRWSTNFLSIDGWRSILLPAMTLGVYQLTLTMRLVRSEMQGVLKTDYIRFARARGINYRSLYLNHALRNTMVPVVTIVALQFGGVIAFSIVTESVFQWPGLGLLFLDSIRYVDIPVMATYLVLIALMFVVLNLLVDLAYALIDPRVRITGEVAV